MCDILLGLNESFLLEPLSVPRTEQDLVLLVDANLARSSAPDRGRFGKLFLSVLGGGKGWDGGWMSPGGDLQ